MGLSVDLPERHPPVLVFERAFVAETPVTVMRTADVYSFPSPNLLHLKTVSTLLLAFGNTQLLKETIAGIVDAARIAGIGALIATESS